MSVQKAWRIATAAGVAVVSAALVTMPLLVRDRLPDPVATHWGPGGAPDDSMPQPLALLVPLGLWLLLVTPLCVIGLRAEVLDRRPQRGNLGAALVALAVFVLGMVALTLAANLDAPDWRQADPVHWWAALGVLAGAALAGVLGRRLGRWGPDRPRPLSKARTTVTVPPGERAVWVSRVSNPVLSRLSWAFLIAGVAGVVVAGTVSLPWPVVVAAAALIVTGVAGFATATVAVTVNSEGLTVAFGPWSWPRRHWRLSDLSGAWVEDRLPSQVGGWGWRGIGNVTLMVRAGQCLVVRRHDGGEFAVSVDDAETGAGLLTTLSSREASGGR